VVTGCSVSSGRPQPLYLRRLWVGAGPPPGINPMKPARHPCEQFVQPGHPCTKVLIGQHKIDKQRDEEHQRAAGVAFSLFTQCKPRSCSHTSDKAARAHGFEARQETGRNHPGKHAASEFLRHVGGALASAF